MTHFLSHHVTDNIFLLENSTDYTFLGGKPSDDTFLSRRVTAPRNRGIPTVYANLRQPYLANENFLEKSTDYAFLEKKTIR